MSSPRNPYSPPAAPLLAPEDGAPRPPQVTLACRILWAVLVAGVLTMHPWIRGEWWEIPEAEDAAAFLAVFAVGMAVLFSIAYAVFIVLIGRRINWARWVFLAVTVAGWLITAEDLPRSLAETPRAAFADMAMAAADLWAFYLLFFGAGARWFGRRAASPQ